MHKIQPKKVKAEDLIYRLDAYKIARGNPKVCLGQLRAKSALQLGVRGGFWVATHNRQNKGRNSEALRGHFDMVGRIDVEEMSENGAARLDVSVDIHQWWATTTRWIGTPATSE